MRDHVYAIVSGNSRYPAGEARSNGGKGRRSDRRGKEGIVDRSSRGSGIVDRSPGIPIIAIIRARIDDTFAIPFHHLSSLGHSFCLHGTMISSTCTRRIARNDKVDGALRDHHRDRRTRVTRPRSEVVHASA